MKIYFTASISLDRSYSPIYKLIVRKLQGMGHEVFSGDVLRDTDETREKLSPKEIFAQEKKLVAEADLLIAEVTTPSWGTAFLMEQALKSKKPVLALYYKESGRQLSPMMLGNPEIEIEYYDEQSLILVLEKRFKLMGFLR